MTFRGTKNLQIAEGTTKKLPKKENAVHVAARSDATGPLFCLICSLREHVDDRADAFSLVHQIERLVDLRQGKTVGDVRLDVQLAAAGLHNKREEQT